MKRLWAFVRRTVGSPYFLAVPVLGAMIYATQATRDVREAMATAATLLAALAALRAAQESSRAARDSRRALALHHRPTGRITYDILHTPEEYYKPEFAKERGTHVAQHRKPQIGSTPSANVNISSISGVHSISVSWSGPDGHRHQATTVTPGSKFALEGVTVISYHGDASKTTPLALIDLRSLSVEARDIGTNTRWVASVPHQEEPRVARFLELNFDLADPS